MTMDWLNCIILYTNSRPILFTLVQWAKINIEHRLRNAMHQIIWRPALPKHRQLFKNRRCAFAGDAFDSHTLSVENWIMIHRSNFSDGIGLHCSTDVPCITNRWWWTVNSKSKCTYVHTHTYKTERCVHIELEFSVSIEKANEWKISRCIFGQTKLQFYWPIVRYSPFTFPIWFNQFIRPFTNFISCMSLSVS